MTEFVKRVPIGQGMQIVIDKQTHSLSFKDTSSDVITYKFTLCPDVFGFSRASWIEVGRSVLPEDKVTVDDLLPGVMKDFSDSLRKVADALQAKAVSE